jgi:4-oxalocrotonate tautomerase
MPLVEITLVEGRNADQLRQLIHATTEAVSQSISAPVDSIRVVIRELPPTHWAAGDVTIAERRQAAQQLISDEKGPTP